MNFMAHSLIRRRAGSVLLMTLLLASVNVLLAEDIEKKRHFFESRIRPILVKHCYECHAAKAKSIKGGFRVDSASGTKRGGDSGQAVVPGRPEDSLLIQALRYDGVEMPPSGRLPDNIVSDFEQWVADGAYDPRDDAANVGPSAARTIDVERDRQIWPFKPLVRKRPPFAPSDQHWPETDLDAFVHAKLSEAKMAPAEDADRRTLIRRLYFDLIGAPPLPEEVESFVHNDSPLATEKLVDRLLASPQFGVQWGRHWLDVARYADSNGGDFNATFHDAWKYRNYVIDAYREDKPFNEFVREQLAGDLLADQLGEASAMHPDRIRGHDGCDRLPDDRDEDA